MIKVLRLFEEKDDLKIAKSCKILGIVPKNDFILDRVLSYIIETSKGTAGEKTFDYDLDFKYYYADFKAVGVDLIDEDIEWFKFTSLLAKFIISDKTMIGYVIKNRTYKKPIDNKKVIEQQIHTEKMKLKRQYSLPQKQSQTNNGLNKLWGYVEQKAGDGSE